MVVKLAGFINIHMCNISCEIQLLNSTFNIDKNLFKIKNIFII